MALRCNRMTLGEASCAICSLRPTVKTHLANLLMKLGVRNRVELAIWAYETKRVAR